MIRLQVLLPDDELERIRARARAKRMTVAEWVRQKLREGDEGGRREDVDRRRKAWAEATRLHGGASPDWSEMEKEITAWKDGLP